MPAAKPLVVLGSLNADLYVALRRVFKSLGVLIVFLTFFFLF